MGGRVLCAASIFGQARNLRLALEVSLIQWSIARRYARALFESVGDDFDRVASELRDLSQAIAEAPGAEAFLADPTKSREAKGRFVEGILAANPFHPMVGNLLRLLAERERLGQLAGIAKIYCEMTDEKKGRIQAEVLAAAPLAPDTESKLRRLLEQATKKEVELSVTLEPGILGGLVAKVGSTVFDGSLRNQLESLRRDLAGRA